MKSILSELRPAIVSTLVLAVVCSGAYPLAVWAVAQTVFPNNVNGSLITDASGAIRGSSLLGQGFTGAKYFHPRPSAAGANGYDAASSSGSNLGPTSQKLSDQIKERIAAYRTLNGVPETTPIPADAVTASSSGLDPHITPANAALQAARVATARGIDVAKVQELITANTDPADLGLLGEPGVNVLKLNLALDAPR